MSAEKLPEKVSEEGTMSLAGHLQELRRRLVISVTAILGFSVLAFIFIQKFVDLMLRLSEQFSFVYLTPAELVTAYLKLSVILGLVFASPIILWQVWAFVRPGLTDGERRSGLAALVAGFGFFLLGALFCYVVVLPMTLSFFYGFNASTDITASISFNSYMTFVLGMLVVFGAVFEMPVLSFMLGRFGVIKAQWLRKGRKYAILIIFVVAAIITPPDAVSQIMTAIPMLALYELSAFVCARAEKMRPAETQDETAETEETAKTT